jgi:hypothetical protein
MNVCGRECLSKSENCVRELDDALIAAREGERGDRSELCEA